LSVSKENDEFMSSSYQPMFIVSISQLISIQGELCVRGYWKTPDKMSKDEVLDWFKEQIENIGLSDVKDTLYFPQTTGNIIYDFCFGGRSYSIY
jgi:hypothetical protein